MAKKSSADVDVFTADYREEGKGEQTVLPEKRTDENSAQDSVPDFSEQQENDIPHTAEDLEPEQDEELDDFLPAGESLRDSAESVPEPVVVQPRSQRRRGVRRYGVVLGAFVLLLALIGVAAIATIAGKQIYQAATDDSALRAYDEFIAPVVMQDPKPFEGPENADREMVQNASLWKTILANNGASYTEYDDSGRALIPVGDVSAACSELFGPDCQLSPQTPEDTFYTYDEETAQYHVAMFSSESAYTPYTESSRKQDGDVILRVAYVTPGSNQNSSSPASDQPVQKRMDYVLRTDKTTGEQYIYAVREVTE